MSRSHDGLRRCILLGALGLGGCEAPLEPRADCDGDGPTRLVTLEVGPSKLSRYKVLRDDRGWLFFDGNEDRGRNIAVECGERPRILARDLPNMARMNTRGPWLGMQQLGPPGDVFALDPWGDAAPRPVPQRLLGMIDDTLVLGGQTYANRVTLWHANLGAGLELQPIPLDLPTTGSQSEAWAVLHPFSIDPVEMIFVTLIDHSDSSVVGVDPRTGETRFVEAKRLTSSKMGGRFVVLSDPEVPLRYTVVDTRDPERRIDLPDGGICCGAEAEVVLLLRAAEGGGSETHLVLLPEMRHLRLEGEWSLSPAPLVVGTTGDHRKVVLGPDGYTLIDPDDPAPVLLYPGKGWARILDDTLWIAHIAATTPLHEASPDDLALVAVPLDGSPPVTVIEPPLSSYLPLSDGRWAVQRAAHYDVPGDLLILDPATGLEEIIAERVDPGFAAWNRNGFLSTPDLWGPSVLPPAPDDTILFTRTTAGQPEVWRVSP